MTDHNEVASSIGGRIPVILQPGQRPETITATISQEPIFKGHPRPLDQGILPTSTTRKLYLAAYEQTQDAVLVPVYTDALPEGKTIQAEISRTGWETVVSLNEIGIYPSTKDVADILNTTYAVADWALKKLILNNIIMDYPFGVGFELNDSEHNTNDLELGGLLNSLAVETQKPRAERVKTILLFCLERKMPFPTLEIVADFLRTNRESIFGQLKKLEQEQYISQNLS